MFKITAETSLVNIHKKNIGIAYMIHNNVANGEESNFINKKLKFSLLAHSLTHSLMAEDII
jgi:hypothetical protein